jgi:hypothetical protein
MIIRVRCRLLEAVKTFQEAGEIPGAFEPGIYRQRSGHIVLSNGVDVWEATRDLREAFRRTEEEAPRINV